MDIKKIDDELYVSKIMTQRGRGRSKGELTMRIEQMELGECIEIRCDDFDEFARVRNAVALCKSRHVAGEFTYSASKNRLSVIVKRVAI